MTTSIPPYLRDRPSFFGEKKRWAISGLAFLASAALFLSYFRSEPDALTYFHGQESYLRWKEGKADWEEFKRELHTIPALEERLSGVLAQDLLEKNKLDQALPYFERAVKKMQEKAPAYASFMQTSLCIEKGDYQEALEKAAALKEALLLEPVSEELFIQNLLRIASLQKKLGNLSGERVAWLEYEAFLEKSELKGQIQKAFREGDVDLFSYIAERKEEQTH